MGKASFLPLRTFECAAACVMSFLCVLWMLKTGEEGWPPVNYSLCCCCVMDKLFWCGRLLSKVNACACSAFAVSASGSNVSTDKRDTQWSLLRGDHYAALRSLEGQ